MRRGLVSAPTAPEEKQLGAVVGLRGAGGVGLDAHADGAGTDFRVREEVAAREEGLKPLLAEEDARSDVTSDFPTPPFPLTTA